MKRSSIWLLLAALFISMGLGTTAWAQVNVVSTIPDFASIAKEVGGDKVTVTGLVRPNQDPHFVDPKPSMMLDLNKADLLLVVGMGLEDGWLPPLLSGARNGKIQRGTSGYLECSTVIKPMQVRAPDRAQGDIHPGGNPHYWIDPRNGLAVASAIAKRLEQIDPANAASYRAGVAAFSSKLQGKMAQWRQRLQPHKDMRVVVYHESWVYFFDFAQIRQVGELEPKPGIAPKPAHVAELIERVKGQSVRYVIQESFYPTQMSRLFAERAGAQLKVLPVMVGAAGTSSYIGLIDKIVSELGG